MGGEIDKMRKVPDFAQVMENMAKNKTKIHLEARYTYQPEHADQIKASAIASTSTLAPRPSFTPLDNSSHRFKVLSNRDHQGQWDQGGQWGQWDQGGQWGQWDQGAQMIETKVPQVLLMILWKITALLRVTGH